MAKKNSNWFFSLLPWADQMIQTEEFMLQNVAYICIDQLYKKIRQGVAHKIGCLGRGRGVDPKTIYYIDPT